MKILLSILAITAVSFTAMNATAEENCAVPLTLYLIEVPNNEPIVFNDKEYHYYSFKDQQQIDCPQGMRKTADCLKRT